MDDLAAAIQDHSHYEGDYDSFWADLLDKYWGEYHKEPGHHTYKGFIIWCEEHDLVGDDEVYYAG